jgi:hypothetical protein
MRDAQTNAIHESSHALVACELSRCYSADIERVSGRLGMTRHREGANVVHEVAIALSGGLGEFLACGQRGPKYGVGCGADLGQVDAVLSRAHGTPVIRQTSKLFILAEELALQILKKHWGLVLHLSQRLETHKKIDGVLAHCALAAARVPD